MTNQSAFLMVWAVGVLLSWIGFGRLAARWVIGKRRVDAGLCAAWGMASLVAVGGVLNALKLCSPAVVIGLTVVGIGLSLPAVVRGFRQAVRHPRRALRRLGPGTFVAIVGVPLLLASIGMTRINLNWIDDPALYMTFPQRMLDSGSADDPLNGRRLSTFGGYAFLQTQIVASGVRYAACVTDLGLANLVVAMLLIGRPRRGGARWAILAVVLLAWLYPWPRLNTMAGSTLTATVLALWRTICLADGSRGTRRGRVLAMAAIVATAAGTFRANILVLPPAFFGLYFVDRVVRSRSTWQHTAREAAVVLGVGIAALLPWSISLYRAAGSFLYPVMHGNHRDASYDFAGPNATAAGRLSTVASTLVSPAFVLISLPLVVLLWQRRWTGVWLYVAALVMSAATVYTFPMAGLQWLERFCVPTLLAGALIGLHAVLRWRLARVIGVAMVAAVATMLIGPGDASLALLRLYGTAVDAGLNYQDTLPAPSQVVRAYAEAQQAIPPGAVVASATDFPLLFDFGRNPILTLDFPGDATKTGVWPFGQGPEAMRQFLIAQGADYVAFADFDTDEGMYMRWWWQRSLGFGDRVGPRMLDMMTNLEALWRQSPHVYDGPRVRVLRLR